MEIKHAGRLAIDAMLPLPYRRCVPLLDSCYLLKLVPAQTTLFCFGFQRCTKENSHHDRYTGYNTHVYYTMHNTISLKILSTISLKVLSSLFLFCTLSIVLYNISSSIEYMN
jgi:hypothetical protein